MSPVSASPNDAHGPSALQRVQIDRFYASKTIPNRPSIVTNVHKRHRCSADPQIDRFSPSHHRARRIRTRWRSNLEVAVFDHHPTSNIPGVRAESAEQEHREEKIADHLNHAGWTRDRRSVFNGH
jgi:hypothetical protein